MRCTVRARRCGSRSRISALASQFDAIHGIPVVDVLPRTEPQPPPVVALERRRQDAPVDFHADALAQQRRHLVEPVAHQIVGPREQRGRLGREQLDHGLGDVGQPRSALLHAEVRRGSPERLLGDGPDAVRDLVDEAPAVLEQLGGDECGEASAAAGVHVVVLRAVAVAHVAQRHRGGNAPPLGAELALRGLHERLTDGGGDGVPPLTLVDRGIGMPALARNEHRGDLRLVRAAGKQVARRLRENRRGERHQNERDRRRSR